MNALTIPPLSPFPGRGAAPDDYIAAADTTMQELPSRFAAINAISAAFNLVAGSGSIGYLPPVMYAAGLAMINGVQSVEYGGAQYSPLLEALPFTTSGEFEAAKFRLVQGITASTLASADGPRRMGWMQAGDGSTLRTAYDKFLESISVMDKGAYCDGVTDDTAALRATQIYAGRRAIAIIGVMHIASPTTITSPILDTMEQIFSETSQVTIANGQPIRPEWFGMTTGNILRAVAATPPPGGVIRLENATYPPQGIAYGIVGAGNFIAKKGIKIEGAKMPAFSIDCLSLVGGTIIEGMLGVYADNFEISNLGIDSGYNVLHKYAGGVITPGQWEGLICSYPDDMTKNAAPLRRGLRLHNIAALTLSPTAPVHGIIGGEGYTDVTCTGEMVTCYGIHGIVFKCGQVSAERLTSYGSGGEGVIIKSDAQASAIATDIQIGAIATYAGGPVGWSPYAVATTGAGVMFHASGNTVGLCQIGSIIDYGHPIGVGTNIHPSFSLDNVQIGSVTGDGNSFATIAMTAPASGNIFRCSIGSISSRNSGTGLLTDWTTPDGILSVDSLSAATCNVALDAAGSSGVMINKITTSYCVSGAIRLRDQARPMIGVVASLNNTPAVYAGDYGGMVPALAAGWLQVFGGSEIFGVELIGFGVTLGGLVKPQAGGQISQLPLFARPKTVKRFLAQGYNGAVISAVPVVIDTDGIVNVNEVGGGHANCSAWLSLSGISYSLLH